MHFIDFASRHPRKNAYGKIIADIRGFIDLSLHAGEFQWDDWELALVKPPEVSCWSMKGCHKSECPAYEVAGIRCWLVAGMMGGIEPTCEFAIKYQSCTRCDVYQVAVYGDPEGEIYEHLVTLVHNLKTAQDKLVTMATRDILTGLFNRNHFNETIGREVARAERQGESVSFMILDLDHFKQINDEYGHQHGDGILRTFADILVSCVRRSDILCRFGGDEFIIVSPDCDCGANHSLQDRINERLAAWNAEFGCEDYRIECSIGCAMLGEGMSVVDAVAKADRLMYEEKIAKREMELAAARGLKGTRG